MDRMNETEESASADGLDHKFLALDCIDSDVANDVVQTLSPVCDEDDCNDADDDKTQPGEVTGLTEDTVDFQATALPCPETDVTSAASCKLNVEEESVSSNIPSVKVDEVDKDTRIDGSISCDRDRETGCDVLENEKMPEAESDARNSLVEEDLTVDDDVEVPGTTSGSSGESKTKQESFKCTASDCRHVAQSKPGLILHLGIHYRFDVTTANKSGETKFSYINGKYVCSLCPLVTYSRAVFEEHVRHHLLHHPYRCGHCGDGMESLSHLRQHSGNVHCQLPVKLVVSTSPRIDSLMSKLGPQAPCTGSKIAARDASDPICIEDDCEDSPDVPNSIQKTGHTERKEPLNQNFKYSLTKDGRLLCAQCKYMTLDAGSFGVHVFNDIHHALKNPCGKCNQRGKQSTGTQDCVIVDQIMRALVRQKELQSLPKDSQEVVPHDTDRISKPKNHGDSAADHRKTSHGQGPMLQELEKAGTPRSPFEETMALLRTLSSDNQCDSISSPSLKISFSEEAGCSGEKSCGGDEATAAALSSGEKRREHSAISLRDGKGDDEQNTSSAANKGLPKEDNHKNNIMANEDNSCTVKTEFQSRDEIKSVKTLDHQTDPGCSRCVVYGAKQRKKLTLEELDQQLKEKLDLETSADSNSSTTYRCGIPGCMFTSNLDLNFKLHCMVKHPGMAALTCSLCQKGFENEDLLLDHINCKHNQGLGNPVEKGIYMCSVKDCGVSFNRIVELKVHFLAVHPHLASFPCSFCFESQPTVDGIMAHVQTHLVNVMKCSYCRKVFNEKDELLGHISSAHEGKPKKINICIKIVNNCRLKPVIDDQNKESSSNGKTSPTDDAAFVEKKDSKDRGNLDKDVFSNKEADQGKELDSSGIFGDVQNVENLKQEPADMDEDNDDVELVAAKDSLSVSCEKCTFTCNTEIQLKLHVYECHTMQPTKGLAFVCKWCNMGTNVKETLQKHVAHHTGRNIVRYYVCPYCSMQSNQMELVEDHVMNDHSHEPFKFEVLQDVIDHLQNMIVCPVCKGSFTWKEDFLHHIGSVHRLEDLVSYMDSTFADKPCLQSYKIPRHLFKDLLPGPVKSKISFPNSSLTSEALSKVDCSGEWNEASTSERTPELGKDGMILRFHCEVCEFSINDYPKYKEHMAEHRSILDGGSASDLNHPSSLDGSVTFADSADTYPSTAEPPRRHMKFCCNFCPFECNKALNYRRHMAIHERNKALRDGFKCGYCQFIHERQNCIKFHLGKYHGHLPTKMSRIIDGQEIDVSSDDDLMRPSRSVPQLHNSTAPPEMSREKRALKQVSRWSASWETPYSFSGRSRRFMRETRHFSSRPMDNIATDYMESDLPAGMIYPEPMKCPKCQFSNRVRINLVRHMKLHQNDGDIGMVDENTDEAETTSGFISLDQSSSAKELLVAYESGEKDCIKIEADDVEFNAPTTSVSLHNRSSSAFGESIRCPSTKSEPGASDGCMASSESDLDHSDSRMSRSGSIDADINGSGSGGRKLYKCCYCSVISKWNRRDISLHILHVHMQKRVYSCQYCSYGSSKSSAIVMSHCGKIHPLKKIAVRDELALFNAIVPVQEDATVTTVGFMKPNGVSILGLAELRQHVGLSGVEPLLPEKRPSLAGPRAGAPSNKRPCFDEDHDQPLDLSVKVKGTPDARNFGPPKAAAAVDDGGVQYVEWKCKLCRFRNRSANHVKRHILCHHLKVKPFSCPYCCLYQWKAQAVVSHIDRVHPGQPKTPVSTANEKVSYLSRNMTRVFVRPGTDAETDNSRRPVAPFKSSAHQSQFTGVCSTSFYRCRQCGFQEVRHDKTKYHVIKQHLKLGLFSCPYCRRYMWGRNYVARHIRSNHPGQEVKIQRTFDEYAAYLRDNIKKIGGSTVESTRTRCSGVPQQVVTSPSSSQCTPPVGSNNLESGAASSFGRAQRSYGCCYCSFQSSLAAKIQSHCLARHPTRPVRYRENTSEAGEKVAASPQIKLEPIEEEGSGTRTVLKSPSLSTNSTTRDLPKSPVLTVKSRTPIEMYMCRYCHHLLWNMEEMMAHLCESHPDDPPEFELLQEPSSSSAMESDGLHSQPTHHDVRKAVDSQNSSTRKADKSCEIENVEDDKSSDCNKDDDDESVSNSKSQSSRRSNQTSMESEMIFKCRLCKYHTDKVTVMRHHVMSHLLYHPYRCPYCDLAHSVKSSPITKHIRLKHPGMEAQFSCQRDDEMERQVRSTYYRTIRDGTESRVPIKSFRKPFTIPLTPKMQKLSRRAFYKCKFCGLVTHIRTDMKHHLMREIHYKPFICGYCNYTEPSRSGMGKHFRSKHCGMVVDIRTAHIPEEDVRVEKMLEECVTRHSIESSTNSESSQDGHTRRSEPFKLLTKKTPAPAPKRPTANSFGSEGGRAYLGFGGAHARPQKQFTSSKMPKLHHCSQCSYTSTSLRPLQAHMVKHRPARLQCGYCSHRSHYPSWVRKHIRSSHPGFPFKYCKAPLAPKPSAAIVKREISIDDPPPVTLSPVPPPISPSTSKNVPASQTHSKKLLRPPQGPALLDGVELDITLIPGKDGFYRCPQCEYLTANRSHYKMHSVIHRPRKWKCFYCSHKFPLIFRLRRHCSIKHPRLPVKWVNVTTEQVCDDSTRVHPSRRYQSGGGLSSTARKSAQGGQSGLTTQMLHSLRSKDAKYSSRSSDEQTIELDVRSYNSQISTDLESDADQTSTELWFCCPNCPKKYSLLPLFVDHLRSAHAGPAGFPGLEVLPPIGEGELTLQRCGFCPYESFFKEDFDVHVRGHTSVRPRRCGHCQFASFVQSDLESHAVDCHPDSTARFEDLDQPYTMTTDAGNNIPDQRVLYNFNPSVKLVDVCKILQDKWDVV